MADGVVVGAGVGAVPAGIGVGAGDGVVVGAGAVGVSALVGVGEVGAGVVGVGAGVRSGLGRRTTTIPGFIRTILRPT